MMNTSKFAKAFTTQSAGRRVYMNSIISPTPLDTGPWRGRGGVSESCQSLACHVMIYFIVNSISQLLVCLEFFLLVNIDLYIIILVVYVVVLSISVTLLSLQIQFVCKLCTIVQKWNEILQSNYKMFYKDRWRLYLNPCKMLFVMKNCCCQDVLPCTR